MVDHGLIRSQHGHFAKEWCHLAEKAFCLLEHESNPIR